MMWNFSPSSQPLLQRCIDAALLKETDNEWTRHFGRKTIEPTAKIDTPIKKTTTEIVKSLPSPPEENKNEISVNYDDFFENISNEIRLDVIVNECTKNPDLPKQMAEKLPTNTVEKLFSHIFATETLEKQFLTDIFHTFLPLHIKLQNSWLTVDLLTKTSEKYPEIFQKLLRILLADINIPNQVLNNYIATLDKNNLTNFLETVSNIEMSKDSFVHNLLTIYTAYKDCQKTDKIQTYVEKSLIRHSENCSSDRTYGRLFLLFLQTAKSLDLRISKPLRECLEIHHSPFKRPCVMVIEELDQKE